MRTHWRFSLVSLMLLLALLYLCNWMLDESSYDAIESPNRAGVERRSVPRRAPMSSFGVVEIESLAATDSRDEKVGVGVDADSAKKTVQTGSIEVHTVNFDSSLRRNTKTSLYKFGSIPAGIFPIKELSTDQSSIVVYEDLQPGQYVVKSHPFVQENVNVRPDKVAKVQLKFPLGMTIKGSVCDERGAPIQAADILSYSTSGSTVLGSTDHKGKFELSGFDDGRYMIGALKSGYSPSELVEVRGFRPGMRKKIELTLSSGGGKLSGLVVDEDNAPINNGVVALFTTTWITKGKNRRPDESSRTCKLNLEGEFEFDCVNVGSGELIVVAPGRQITKQLAKIGTSSFVRIQLEKSAVLQGKVQTQEGRPLSWACVRYAKEGNRELEQHHVFTDVNGAYRLDGLPSGTIEFLASKNGFGQSSHELHLVSGEVTEQDFVLDAGRTITGRVISQDGMPLTGWFIKGHLTGTKRTGECASICDADGKFTLANCEDTEYSLDVFNVNRELIEQVHRVWPGSREFQIRVDFGKLSRVVGRLDATDASMRNAKVVLRGVGSWSVLPEVNSGEFCIENVPPGEHRLSVTLGGSSIIEPIKLDLKPGVTKDVGIVAR